LAEGAQGRDTETQETRAGQGTPVAGSFVFLGIPFLLVTGRGQVRYVADGARGASSAAVSYPDNQLRSTSRGGAVAGTPVPGCFGVLGIPFLLVTGRGQVRRGDNDARLARAASSAAVSYLSWNAGRFNRAALSAVSAGAALAAFSARRLRISSRWY
jgi:hypothetical protein